MARKRLVPQCHPERPHYGKGQCKSCYQQAYNVGHRIQQLRRLRQRYLQEPNYRKRRKEQAWAAQVKRLYGLTQSEYWTLYEKQDGACVLCKREVPPGRHLAVDHDHVTNEVRGLLCSTCNRALSYVERPEWISQAFRHVHQYGHPAFDARMLEVMDLHARKNHDYALGGPPLGNFTRTGKIMQLYPKFPWATDYGCATVQMLKQLDAFLWQAQHPAFEAKIEGGDSRLRDIAVFSQLIAIMMHEQRAGNHHEEIPERGENAP